MDNFNQTSVRRFILLGLSSIPGLQVVFFLLFSMMYTITLFGNFLLITVVQLNPRLQTPMYFFLSNLSVIDICFSTAIVPKILFNTISEDRSITFLGCATQLYFHLALGATECVILGLMAYDRYNAICKPLRYSTIMDKHYCTYLAAGTWITCFSISIIHVIFAFQLPFCKSNKINHFFCEMPPVFRLSCQDPWINELSLYICCGVFTLFTFLLTCLSYFYILSTILKIPHNSGRQKAFSTCGSHLMVVTLYYGTIMFMYLRPRSSYSPDRDRVISVIYSVVSPMLNPIIYSMRNTDIKRTLQKKVNFIVCF
ncbi:olfactory receptor-like protein OLF1 [Hyperolius riggenbachi]|uniref:olfactory receptor-like protein OLF1 n=1 Tax=Hyperolius riggenbachi TaxID=752182 RepID=UPI0035A28011